MSKKNKKEIDGVIDGKPVKVIIKETPHKKQVFAKPKNKDIELPHFETYEGTITVHQDSKDGMMYSVMNCHSVAGTAVGSGTTFAQNNDMDFAFLPVEEQGNNFVLRSGSTATEIRLQKKSKGLIAYGKWRDWKEK